MNLSKKTTWLIIHVFIPLTPFLGSGLLRLIVSSQWSGGIFRMGELAVSLGLLGVYLNQSLVVSHHVIGNPDDEEARKTWAVVWVLVAAAFFVLFGLIVAFETAVAKLQASMLVKPLGLFEIIVGLLSIPVIWMAMVMQSHFKLRASI